MSTIYTAAGMGITCHGPAGVLISLGVEYVVSDLTRITLIYNYWSILTTMIIAATAGQWDSKYMSLLMPLWAGFCMLVGWLKYPDQGAGFGILVVCAAMSIMTYMVEKRHERFGIAGPGNMVVKIFTFLIILQCSVVFLNSAAIFPSDTQLLAQSNSQYVNIDLTSQINQISGSGGLLAGIMDIATITLQLAASALLMVIKCLVSIALFAWVIAQVFPWIVQAGAVGTAFLILMQFAIWTMYLLFVFYLFYRPGPDPGW